MARIRTFTPAIGSGASSTDDLERDQVLTQRIKLFTWIKPYHLDLPVASPSRSVADALPSPVSPTGDDQRSEQEQVQPAVTDPEKDVETKRALSEKRKRDRQAYSYLDFAQREMTKINHYKAPRDKMICIMNTCKVIFGALDRAAWVIAG